MTREKKRFFFIVLISCLLLPAGLLLSPASAGSTGAALITAKISLTGFDIAATTVGQTLMTITWKTNGNANSTVEYGLTTGYGSTQTNPFMETNHTITLGGLAPGTLYHWRVVSRDQDENTFVSTDYVCQTLPTTPVGPETNSIGDGGGTAPGEVIRSGIPMLVSEEGQILKTYIITTGEEAGFTASLTVPLGTIIHGAVGEPINGISVKVLGPVEVPPVPDGAAYSFSGFSIQCLPDDATFSKPASLKFHLATDQWSSLLEKADSSRGSLRVRFYDKVNLSWISIPTRVDPLDFAVIATITHCGTYGLFIDAIPTPSVTGSPTATAQIPAGIGLPAQTPTFPTEAGSMNWAILFGALIMIVAAGIGYYFVAKKK